MCNLNRKTRTSTKSVIIFPFYSISFHSQEFFALALSNQRSSLQNGRLSPSRSKSSLLLSVLRLPSSATGGGRLSVCFLIRTNVQLAKWSYCSLPLAFLPFAKRPSPPFLRHWRRSASGPCGTAVSLAFLFKRKRDAVFDVSFLAPPVGLEPTTLRLTAACSTN